MSKDIFHQIVKDTLIKDGWQITYDPYEITSVIYLVNYCVGISTTLLSAIYWVYQGIKEIKFTLI